MPFSEATITSVSVSRDGLDLLVSWTTTSPAGTLFQVYFDRQLIWYGTDTVVSLPYPTALGPTVLIDVGTVLPGEETIDFSANFLPAAPPDKAELTWQGGTWEATDIAGFHIYACDSPATITGYNQGTYGGGGYNGGASSTVDFTKLLGTVNAYTANQVTDGWNFGGYGLGGYGVATGVYKWVSAHLAPGAWTFAVAAFDLVGNEDASPPTTIVIIIGPPRPPAPNSAGLRVTYTYNQPTRTATLHWLASPGY